MGARWGVKVRDGGASLGARVALAPPHARSGGVAGREDPGEKFPWSDPSATGLNLCLKHRPPIKIWDPSRDGLKI